MPTPSRSLGLRCPIDHDSPWTQLLHGSPRGCKINLEKPSRASDGATTYLSLPLLPPENSHFSLPHPYQQSASRPPSQFSLSDQLLGTFPRKSPLYHPSSPRPLLRLSYRPSFHIPKDWVMSVVTCTHLPASSLVCKQGHSKSPLCSHHLQQC